MCSCPEAPATWTGGSSARSSAKCEPGNARARVYNPGVQRRVQIIVVALAVLIVASMFVYVKRTRPAAAPEQPATTAARPSPVRAAPVAESAPVPVTPPPSARRAPKRAAPVPVAPAPDAAPEGATLHFTSDVPGAQVFIDRQFIGAAPVTAEHITPGSHQLNASAEGFDGIAETIDVEPGPRDVPLRFREVRLDARVVVVHKHRLGACTGQLSATAQELRYDTSNKDDAFRVPLADVDAIAVDYLQKNLRVKLRKGKTYNFTDPAGNADRLFVFQRDVEKVRQRLAKGDQPAAN